MRDRSDSMHLKSPSGFLFWSADASGRVRTRRGIRGKSRTSDFSQPTDAAVECDLEMISEFRDPRQFTPTENVFKQRLWHLKIHSVAKCLAVKAVPSRIQEKVGLQSTSVKVISVQPVQSVESISAMPQSTAGTWTHIQIRVSFVSRRFRKSRTSDFT